MFFPASKPCFHIMTFRFAALFALLLSQFAIAQQLPFDRSAISRYSLDGVPRSISIRQGADTWLGYDLDRATILKVWRTPEGKAGLEGAFTVKSVGEALFEDKSDEGWTWNGEPVEVRYLGCSDFDGRFELRWEFRKGARKLQLTERVSAIAREGVSRELRIEGLEKGESLALPAAAGAAWKTKSGKAAKEIPGNQWIRINLA
jgi:hypothetical protein